MVAEPSRSTFIEGVTIAVVTYLRPDSLAALLPRLSEQAWRNPGRGVRVLVVDNDPCLSAKPVVESALQSTSLDVRYLHEPIPGIAAARNRALDETRTTILVFIDDDEIPTEGWLSHCLHTYDVTGTAAVAGPVLPVYSTSPRPWIESGPFHRSPDISDGAYLTHAATGNLLLDMRQIRALGVRMPTIGTRGGEDISFTDAIVRQGGLLVWSRNAVVHEHIVPSRGSARWALTRSMVDGNNESSRVLGAVSGGVWATRLRLAGAGATRLIGGGLRAGVGAFRGNSRIEGYGLHTAVRGLGMLLGALGLVHDTYARSRGRKWKWERRTSQAVVRPGAAADPTHRI